MGRQSQRLDAEQSRFTGLIVLYSLQRVIAASANSLRFVDLRENNLSCLSPLLLESLSECTSLERLDVSSNCVGMAVDDELKMAFQTLLIRCDKLQTLILDDNGLDDTFAAVLVAILANHSRRGSESRRGSASDVDLQCIKLSIVAAATIETALNLKTLSLKSNRFTIVGAKNLFRTICTSDIAVDLASNDIDKKEWRGLRQSVLKR